MSWLPIKNIILLVTTYTAWNCPEVSLKTPSLTHLEIVPRFNLRHLCSWWPTCLEMYWLPVKNLSFVPTNTAGIYLEVSLKPPSFAATNTAAHVPTSCQISVCFVFCHHHRSWKLSQSLTDITEFFFDINSLKSWSFLSQISPSSSLHRHSWKSSRGLVKNRRFCSVSPVRNIWGFFGPKRGHIRS